MIHGLVMLPEKRKRVGVPSQRLLQETMTLKQSKFGTADMIPMTDAAEKLNF